VLVALAALTGLTACGTPHADVSATRARSVTAQDRYVALGDSYTSAPGVGTPTGPTACIQTSLNYPHLVAKKLGLDLHDASCGGAKTSDLTGSQKVRTASIAPQLDALTSDTGLVTLSIGANDDGTFANLILTCGRLGATHPTGSPCTDQAGDVSTKLDDYQKILEDRITSVIAGIAQRAPKARVLVVGYPHVVPASGTCAELPFAAGDIPYAYRVNLMLNDAVRAAAERADAEFINIWAASEGHDICGADPWIAGLRPVHPAIVFHPYAAEERAVAGLIEKALA
jgi:lysophospholipase L1-like esterase